MNQGIAFFAGPDDLGLPVLGHEGVLAVLRDLPRDETVVLLAYLSTMLHAFGEVGRSVQVEGVKAWLREPARERALRWMEQWPNGIVFTYEAVVRLTVLAIEHGDPRSRDITDDDVTRLMSLLPEVQAWLARLHTIDAPNRVAHSTEDREDTAFTLFLVVNAPGMSASRRVMLDSVTLGALAARRIKLTAKTERQAVEVLRTRAGGDVAEVHAAAAHLSNYFLFNEKKLADGKSPAHLINVAALKAHRNRLGDVGSVLAEALVTAPASDDTAITVPEALGPKAALPDRLRWRPMYRWSSKPEHLACWDVRTFQAMLGGRFPEWLKLLMPDAPASQDALGSAWDHAVEAGLDEMIRPVLPTWSRPPKIDGTNCDRWFAEGDHLFLVDVKNIRPGDALGTGTAHDFKNWVRSKFFKKDGFPQIDGTLTALDHAGHKFGTTKLRRFNAIWPVILCWTKMPGHPHVTDLLQRLRDEKPSVVPERLRNRLRPPVIIDYDTFFTVLSCLPDLRERGVGLGQVLDGFLALRVDRPMSVAEYARNLVPNAKIPPEMMKVMGDALEGVQAIGQRMKG